MIVLVSFCSVLSLAVSYRMCCIPVVEIQALEHRTRQLVYLIVEAQYCVYRV